VTSAIRPPKALEPCRSSKTAEGLPAGLERGLPHNLFAEEALLSAVLIDNSALADILEILSPEDFYHGAHARIFAAMADLHDGNQPIDLVTLYHHLQARGDLERCGGAAGIARLIDAVPAAVNASHYAQIVYEKALIRGMVIAGRDIVGRCLEDGVDLDGLIDFSQGALFNIINRRVRSSFVAIGRLNKGNLAKIRLWCANKSLVRGLPTGFKRLDRLTHGLQAADLVILAARPAMGKTALALNMARNVAVETNLPVAVFSLEMSKEQLSLRMLCAEAQLNAGRIRDGFMSKADWRSLERASRLLSDAPILIDDSAELTATQIRAKARRLQMEHGLGLVIVDYLQLIKSPFRLDRRDLEISEISRSLKALAKELDIPVIALSQLNRELEKRTNKRPRLSDLRESGSLEQDADLVLFIHRESVYQDESVDSAQDAADLIVAKHRNGPTGAVGLIFQKAFTRFDNPVEAPARQTSLQ